MLYFKILLFSLLISISIPGIANKEMISHGANIVELQKAIENNERWHQSTLTPIKPHPFKPVEDTASFAYVLMSAYEYGEEVADLRKTIAEHLPKEMKLVILTDYDLAEEVRDRYLQWIDKDRLIIATDSSTINGFWARDAFPIPVYKNRKKEVSLVAANYFRDFSSWKSIAKTVNASLEKKNFIFVGGNLLADEMGNCFTVDSDRLFSLNKKDLQSSYGCKTVHILPFLRGIGDVDEVLKPLPGKKILTNVIEYKDDLESWGYEVILLPSLPDEYRTYANSLIVRDIVFMPIYEVPEDAKAKQVYEDLGYKVIPIQSIDLSDNYYGSIHCQTMAYPPMKLHKLFNLLNVTEYK